MDAAGVKRNQWLFKVMAEGLEDHGKEYEALEWRERFHGLRPEF